MKIFLGVNEIYKDFVAKADLYEATQAAAKTFAGLTADVTGEPLKHRTQKLCRAAKARPNPRFGDFVRDIARHAAGPQPLSVRDGVTKPLEPTVLKRERMDEQLMRRLDIQGKAIAQVCAHLMVEGAYAHGANGVYCKAVVARVNQRLVVETRPQAQKGLKKLFDELRKDGIGNEALEKAVAWFGYPSAEVDLPGATEALRKIAAHIDKAQREGTPLPARTRRDVAEAAVARPLLQFIAALQPQRVPAFVGNPALEETFCIFLHKHWLPKQTQAMQQVHRAVELVELLERYSQEGEAVFNELRWSVVERQAALCLCKISAHIDACRQSWLQRGCELAHQENLSRLTRKITKAGPELSPECLDMLQERAWVLSIDEHRDSDALADLNIVVQKRPTASAFVERSIVHANLADWREAERDATAADKLLRESDDDDGVERLKLYALRGTTRLRLRRTVDALADLIKVRLLSPNKPYTELQEDLERAMAAAYSEEIAVMQTCDAAQMSHWLKLQQARTQMVIGNFPQAKVEFENALKSRPDCGESQAGVAAALELQEFMLNLPAQIDGDAEVGPLVGLEGMRADELQALFEQLGQAASPESLPSITE